MTTISELMQRSCNRHVDCDIAEAQWTERALRHAQAYKEQFPNSGPVRPQTLPAGFHCHDECCPDCFGD